MLDVLSGPAEGDVHTPPAPPRPFAEAAAQAPGKLRVALSFRPAFPVPIHGEIRAAVESLADVIRSLGHVVTEADPAYNELGTVVIPRYLKGIQARRRGGTAPASAPAPDRGLRRDGPACPEAALDNALRDEATPGARGSTRSSTTTTCCSPRRRRSRRSARRSGRG